VRVGLVCPYSLDVPGGVQNHVRDLAEALIEQGHQASVLAPADEESVLPPYVVSAGRAVPVPFNGSVARLTFGPVSAARARRWIREGGFDLLHIHEPGTPSVSVLTLWAATGPIVATFHTATPRSRAMSAASVMLRPSMEKIGARIAVSEEARATSVQHIGGEPVVIPNGLYVDRIRLAAPVEEWRSAAGTLVFLGRLEEPRKGLSVLLEAFPRIAAERPGVRLLVAGRGDTFSAQAALPARCRDDVTFLGEVDDHAKARLLRSADIYVAPNTGAESFGIVLVEAMAAGAPVLASALPSFRRVVEGGRLGALFEPGDPAALSDAALALLADPARRGALAAAAAGTVRRYDWSALVRRILDVYETVVRGAGPVGEDLSRR
jgi:phosphatidylinositol alpha-mannosyltransferase